jgi:hypothetical protein
LLSGKKVDRLLRCRAWWIRHARLRGGIGENAPIVRTRICAELNFLGIELDKSRNAKTEAVISKNSSRVTVRVIRTNEELMIARSVCRVLRLSPPLVETSPSEATAHFVHRSQSPRGVNTPWRREGLSG